MRSCLPEHTTLAAAGRHMQRSGSCTTLPPPRARAVGLSAYPPARRTTTLTCNNNPRGGRWIPCLAILPLAGAGA